VIKFSARALKILSGKLTIEASYSVTSKTVRLLSHLYYSCLLILLAESLDFSHGFSFGFQRVDIKLESSTITPEQVKIHTYHLFPEHEMVLWTSVI
jgi:hypothetical protein